MPNDTPVPGAPVTYGASLRLDALLELQRPLSGAGGAPEHPDELLFIAVHQASELWFKVVRAELDALHDRLAAAARDAMTRLKAAKLEAKSAAKEVGAELRAAKAEIEAEAKALRDELRPRRSGGR